MTGVRCALNRSSRKDQNFAQVCSSAAAAEAQQLPVGGAQNILSELSSWGAKFSYLQGNSFCSKSDFFQCF